MIGNICYVFVHTAIMNTPRRSIMHSRRARRAQAKLHLVPVILLAPTQRMMRTMTQGPSTIKHPSTITISESVFYVKHECLWRMTAFFVFELHKSTWVRQFDNTGNKCDQTQLPLLAPTCLHTLEGNKDSLNGEGTMYTFFVKKHNGVQSTMYNLFVKKHNAIMGSMIHM